MLSALPRSLTIKPRLINRSSWSSIERNGLVSPIFRWKLLLSIGGPPKNKILAMLRILLNSNRGSASSVTIIICDNSKKINNIYEIFVDSVLLLIARHYSSLLLIISFASPHLTPSYSVIKNSLTTYDDDLPMRENHRIRLRGYIISLWNATAFPTHI